MGPTYIRRVARWAAAGAACLAAVAPARGFFFKGWPGDGLERAPGLVGPVLPELAGQPPGGEPGERPPGRDSGPGSRGPEVATVPEPTTAVMIGSGIGSGAVAVALARRVVTRRRDG